MSVHFLVQRSKWSMKLSWISVNISIYSIDRVRILFDDMEGWFLMYWKAKNANIALMTQDKQKHTENQARVLLFAEQIKMAQVSGAVI